MLKTIFIVLIFLVFLFIIYKVFQAISSGLGLNEEIDMDYERILVEQIETYKKANRWQDAFNIAKEYVSKNPTQESPRYIYSKLLFDAEKYYDAIGHLNLILKSHDDSIRTSILLGDCFVKTKQFTKAVNVLKDIAEKNPSNKLILSKLAEVYIFKKEKRNAIPLYKKLIELTDDEYEIKGLRLMVTNLYFELRDWDNLVSESTFIMEAYPDDKNILLYLKKAYLVLGDSKNAIDIIERLIELDNYNAKHYEDIVELYLKENDAGNALKYAEEALKMRNVNKVFVKNAIAKAHILNRDFDVALDFLQNSIEYDVRDKDLKKTLADLHCLMNNFEQSITVYEELIDEAHPRELDDLAVSLADIYFEYGNYLVKHDSINLAFEKYLKAIETNPANSNFYFVLAELNVKIKNYQDAVQYYKSAIEIDPNEADYYLKLANLYYDIDNILDAKKCYSDAILIKPNCALAHAAIGLIHSKQKNPEAAIASFKTAISIEPQNVDFRYNLALAYEFAGDVEKAIQEYNKVLEIIPNHREAKNNLSILTNLY